MLTVRRLPEVGLVALTMLLAAVWASVGLTAAGWGVGLFCGALLNPVVAVALHRTGARGPGPADVVTLTRAMLACGLAALTADALVHQVHTHLFVPIAVVALALDALDGWVARRTHTCSAFGSRFDGEVDAFLILVLSVYVTPTFGAWILSAGLMRYAFAVAGCGVPWLRARLPYRFWRKVVTASTGIVLTLAAADVQPRWLSTSALVVGLALLVESFGRDVWWSWRHRVVTAEETASLGATPMAPARAPTRARIEPV
ncbi:CDP-alcohol phosphatidyltransferase family protein [Pedococcus sp. KACC 23699]|uniref:CDP-alcohol phosphatidyltransferase family protein n=1 Tax=Pedococcus sp. KACC 23699 TaxID=3149228 RepID=A0AAU7JSD8_9MICO